VKPTLRLSQFTDEWRKALLSDLLTIKHGKSQSEIENKDGEYPILGSGGVIGKAIKPLYSKPSVLIGRKGTIDKPYYYDKPFWTIDTLFYSEIKNGNDPKFLYYVFNTINWKLYNEGSGLPSLSASTISRIKVCVPSLAEQKKIAEFLTAVDERIDILTRRVELLKRYKTGVAEALFSRRLRLAGFSGDWERKKLGETLDFIGNGLSLDQNSLHKGYAVTRIETISNNDINMDKVGFVKTNNDIKEYKLKIGDLLFSNINSPVHIGKIVRIDKDYNLYHGMNLLRMRVNKENSSTFVFYVLSSNKYRKYFERICNKAVNQASINQSDLQKTELEMPSRKEQETIATFLSTMDEKIKLESSIILSVTEFKKSLLQRMFV
jgi:type I restriction enzyme S subunit